MTKIHKIPPNSKIKDLPIKPITPNLGTFVHIQLEKQLAKLLPPLCESDYAIKKEKGFYHQDSKTKEIAERFPNGML